MPRSYRRASFAGSWYEKNGSLLQNQIRTWLEESASKEEQPRAQAIIAPHAGYAYCGHVMAHAYGRIDKSSVDCVFLFGPSHRYYTDRCVLSSANSFQTPLGDIEISEEIYEKLVATELFEVMDLEIDEAEHSLELHTPYIQHVLSGKAFKLVPIMIGVLSVEMEEKIAKELTPYLNNPANLFIVSSDFCHWGKRFSYTPYDDSKGPIWQYIEWLDHEGIRLITKGNTEDFRSYLQTTRNTICGRYPIGLFLKMLEQNSHAYDISFLCYDQSSKCWSFEDSSPSKPNDDNISFRWTDQCKCYALFPD